MHIPMFGAFLKLKQLKAKDQSISVNVE